MSYEVRFRFNNVTGEVEEFVVEATDAGLPEPEHNRRHEERAGELARLLERNPRVIEMPADATAAAPPPTQSAAEPEPTHEHPAQGPRRQTP